MAQQANKQQYTIFNIRWVTHRFFADACNTPAVILATPLLWQEVLRLPAGNSSWWSMSACYSCVDISRSCCAEQELVLHRACVGVCTREDTGGGCEQSSHYVANTCLWTGACRPFFTLGGSPPIHCFLRPEHLASMSLLCMLLACVAQLLEEKESRATTTQQHRPVRYGGHVWQLLQYDHRSPTG